MHAAFAIFNESFMPVAFAKDRKENSMTLHIACFSASGVTRQAAERIQKLTGAEISNIEPAVPYTNADLNWRDRSSRSTLEMKSPMAPVELADVPELKDGDTLLLGYPIWWYEAPAIINSFLARYPKRKLTIIPFATSGGSTIEHSEKLLKKRFKTLEWKDGLLIDESTSDARLVEWLARAGIPAAR